MKRSTLCLALALPLLTTFGCAADDTNLTPPAELTQKLTGFRFDTTAIAATPPATLPAGLLTLSAFADDGIVRNLIQTTESFAPGMRVATLNELVAPSWKFERDQSQGALLVLKTVPTGRPSPQDEAVLQRSAQLRLDKFGIPSIEIGRVLARQTLLQDQDDKGVSAPETHRYKTFFFRSINRVPVEGHRAVVSHAPDGSFVRAYLKWPALATSGHKLTTRMAPAEVVRRATEALTAEGETGGEVRLSWKYVATPLPSGEVALTLAASARLAPATPASETRAIDVEVDAL